MKIASMCGARAFNVFLFRLFLFTLHRILYKETENRKYNKEDGSKRILRRYFADDEVRSEKRLENN